LLLLALALMGQPCTTGCVEGQTCYTLVLKYVVNTSDVGQRPQYVTRETFTPENYPTIADAFCGARKIRREGYVVLLDPSGPESNVMPESITPHPVF
jgi:hypothetical protein